MTLTTLMSSVLPGTGPAGGNLACAEVYSDPPGLTPMAEEEPLIARSVAKRRNEFITVRYCARIALGELGFPPVPILKGDKGEPCWPDGVVGSLTHCAGYRGAVVGCAVGHHMAKKKQQQLQQQQPQLNTPKPQQVPPPVPSETA